MDFLSSTHPLANTPFNQIEGVRVRNKAAKDWKQFTHWKIGKNCFSQLCQAWRDYNDFAILPPAQPQPTTLGPESCSPSQSCA